MELRARTLPFARRAAFTAALGVLLVPVAAGTATADAAKRAKKYPVITSVQPLQAKIGDTIAIKGKNFKRGKNKNTVVFKRDGARAIFVKLTLGTARQVRVQVPETLRPFIDQGAAPAFRLRVFSGRFGKRFTSTSKSPRISAPPIVVSPGSGSGAGSGSGSGSGSGAAPGGAPAGPAPVRVCTGDDDNDLLGAALENSLGLDACNADSDGDGVPDGYEYQSARDLNDDEFQDPNSFLPYPGKRPYPNGLDKDAGVDHDGDSLTLLEEYRLWKAFGNVTTLAGLIYSAGEAFSVSMRDGSGRRRPTQPAAGYGKQTDFLNWAEGSGYRRPMLSLGQPWHDSSQQVRFWLLDFNRSSGDMDRNGTPDGAEESGSRPGYLDSEMLYYDLDGDGYLSDDERDEDADGLTNYDEAHGRLVAEYWAGCYSLEQPYQVVYAGTDLADADTDGDGVRDGADDQDHDDIPNLMEMSRNAASGHADWDPNKGQCVPDESLLVADGTDEGEDPDAPKTLHPNDYGRVNPYNPCLPFTWSRTCDRHPSLGNSAAPFDGSTNWFSLQ